MRQLWNFEQAVRSGRHPELTLLSGIKKFECLVVSYDHLYLANSVIRDKIRQHFIDDDLSIPADFHWQVISIDELESVLGMHGSDFLRVLREKRLSKDDDESDFNDYLARYYADRNQTNPYLERIRKAFFGRLNLE